MHGLDCWTTIYPEYSDWSFKWPFQLNCNWTGNTASLCSPICNFEIQQSFSQPSESMWFAFELWYMQCSPYGLYLHTDCIDCCTWAAVKMWTICHLDGFHIQTFNWISCLFFAFSFWNFKCIISLWSSKVFVCACPWSTKPTRDFF